MNKKYFLLLGILLVLPLAFAQTYQRETVVDLKVPFEVNGSIPSTSATCNISIDHPDETYLKENTSMTNLNNGDFNITLNISETNQLGEHEWRAFCCDGTNCAVGYGSFEITNTGDKLESQSSIYVTLLIINIFFLIVSLILSIKIPYGNEIQLTRHGPAVTKVSKIKYLKIFSIWFSYVLFVWFITLITGLINNYIFFEPLRDMATSLYTLTNTLGFGVNIFMVVFLIVMTWRDIVLNKEILNNGMALINKLK